MKFVINGDNLTIVGSRTINSGSLNDYLIQVQTDQSWNNLSIEAIINKENSTQGLSRAVINNAVYIDMPKKERYTIGFIGYTIVNNEKTLQKSTNLKVIPIVKGAGEIEAINSEEIPTITEWEIYLNQVQLFINNANQVISEANNLDVNADGETLTITKKDGTQKSVNIKGEKGDCYFATFEIINGRLIMNKPDELNQINFRLNSKGHLEMEVSV